MGYYVTQKPNKIFGGLKRSPIFFSVMFFFAKIKENICVSDLDKVFLKGFSHICDNLLGLLSKWPYVIRKALKATTI